MFLTNVELQRLKDAFRRTSGLSCYMSQQCFLREVLGDVVPLRIAEVIYSSFGGTSKGLHFNNLIVGLVLLTRGRDEEKAKYIFSLFASDLGNHATREDMESMLQTVDGEIPLSLRKCFSEGEKVNYEKFKSWLLQNKDAFTFSRWLLSSGVCVTLTDDSDTPTFYQTLAGVTHLEESDIIDLEKRYWLLKAQSRTGRFDLETFVALVSPTIHTSLSEGLFHAFDENRDNHIDFKEISCGLSACCRGPLAERQKFCFKVFDVDHDGLLSRKEITEMVGALLEVWKDNRIDLLPVSTIWPDWTYWHLTLEDYQIWSVKSAFANEFLNLLFQVCHIVLGLRPASPEEEGQIIRGWLERASRHGLQPGDYWFLIAVPWWQQWRDYVKYDNKHIVVEQPLVFDTVRSGVGAGTQARAEQGPEGESMASSHSSTEEKFVDNISSASEASETTSGLLPQGSTATDICFARQHDDTDNQCFLGADGNMVVLRPGAIDNQPLVRSEPLKAPTLTMEGGLLRRSPSLILGRDFEVVPEPVWRSLYHWYGANLGLPRPVIRNTKTDCAELELLPRHLLFLRQQQPPPRTPQNNVWVNMGKRFLCMCLQRFSKGNVPSPSAPLKRVLVYTGCFSRVGTIKDIHEYLSQRLRIKEEDMRLWLYNSENYLTLLDDEDHSLEGLKIPDEQYMVIEVRNKDMSWPEEMSFIANSNRMNRHNVPTEKGATGLSNLGNTCFMNSSIQCVSNTKPLTDYFTSGNHLYELNRYKVLLYMTNPIGMRGHMAKCYGDLVQELWSGTQKNLAPLKLRWTIAKYAPRFNGFQQQDSQELLAFLLDGLHEDLNRVHEKPYVELKDSDGRPDWEVASEAWENHLRRNRSIVVDLFHGQLRSQVKCKTCGHVSARFDPFNFLSLPLPMDNSMHVEIIVTKLDGSCPVRYGLRLNADEKYTGLKRLLSELCCLNPEQILLAEVHASNIKNFPLDNQKVRQAVSGFLCAFEIPVPSAPTSVVSTPTQTDGIPIAYGNATMVTDSNSLNLGLIPKGMPSTVVPCGTEGSLANGLPDGPVVLPSDSPFTGYIITIHRKMMRAELYFLSSQKNRPSLFGMPLIVPCTVRTRTRDLYDSVWTQVSRLASPLPPQEASNHAQDCDDSMGYQYPFTLRVVQKDGNSCAWCPWYRFCRGCTVECNDERAAVGNAFMAVDWDPTALHLRYQTSQERIVEEHPSVEQSRRAQAEPISLDSCLQAFTSEEELGEDELYYCSKCKTHRLATKKLDLWRLPPILIIHLKRFQFMNGRWIKSQKIVRFPMETFDPSAFLTPRDADQSQESWRDKLGEELHDTEGGVKKSGGGDTVCNPALTLNNGKGLYNILTDPLCSGRMASTPLSKDVGLNCSPESEGRRQGRGLVFPTGSRYQLSLSKESLDSGRESPMELEASRTRMGSMGEGLSDSTSGEDMARECDNTKSVSELNSNGYTENSMDLEASQGQRDLDPMYNLYAISCHSGILGGGHYVTYAKNPNEKWYCYNDSSCKELQSEEIDADSAYILFYEQQEVDYSLFMPKTDGKKMADTTCMDEDFESDYKKYCVLQ
uniref:Ubiquitin carboxyl-terminal hydrolase 32 n=1 Tax=Oncorhynchus tshawytscha TaxID=74940 RepID=A0A8C8D233_ONCTS